MKKGGYQIIDLKGETIAVGGSVYPGIYDKISKTEGKAFLLSGINLGSGAIKDRFVSLDKADTSYFGAIDATHVIYIDGDDTVTIVSETLVPMATTSTPGVVIAKGGTFGGGSYVSISGSTSANPGALYIGNASDTQKGVVQVGTGLTVTNGVISVTSELLNLLK